MADHDPRAEYQSRLGRCRAEHAREEKLFRTIGDWRGAMGAAAAVIAYLALFRDTLSAWWLLAPFAVFVFLVVWHDRVVRRQQLAARAIAFYDLGLARLEDRWMGKGNAGEQFRDPNHVYSEDLDLFGKGSLFELISTVRTGAGEETLARWLLGGGPAASEIVQRQQAVAELRGRLDLREDLALLGEDVRAGVSPGVLTAWSASPAVEFPRGAREAALALALLAVAAFGLWMGDVIGPRPFIYVAFVEVLFAQALKKRVEHIIHSVDKPASQLAILSLVLARLEREHFQSTRLAELRLALDRDAGHPASRLIAALDALVEKREWSENLAFRVPAFLLMWNELFAMRIEQWKKAHGADVPRWIAVAGEMEALGSLAGYAYEHPQAPFPEIAERVCIEAEALCHPLMAASQCVPNDVRLGGSQALLIVSGSNMSGKSTLLRAIGLNVVLAWAGAPVAARRLALSPLAMGASIRVLDSLQTGRSRFYAEITRIRQILNLTIANRSVLFLMDELLNGTNSHDRRIGAEAVLRNLLDRGAIGLVTTHDLALADIAEALPGRAVNVHFEDQLDNGKIHFDYILRPGVVKRSNALELMRGLGLIGPDH